MAPHGKSHKSLGLRFGAVPGNGGMAINSLLAIANCGGGVVAFADPRKY
jgi:hypothetical protein